MWAFFLFSGPTKATKKNSGQNFTACTSSCSSPTIKGTKKVRGKWKLRNMADQWKQGKKKIKRKEEGKGGEEEEE